ncbi:hypothetical protein BGX30_007439, partial [Mortierella sp. GBA39]
FSQLANYTASTLPAELVPSAKDGFEQSTLAGSKVAPAWRRSGSQQKRKALMFPVDLKDPFFAAPSVLRDSPSMEILTN